MTELIMWPEKYGWKVSAETANIKSIHSQFLFDSKALAFLLIAADVKKIEPRIYSFHSSRPSLIIFHQDPRFSWFSTSESVDSFPEIKDNRNLWWSSFNENHRRRQSFLLLVRCSMNLLRFDRVTVDVQDHRLYLIVVVVVVGNCWNIISKWKFRKCEISVEPLSLQYQNDPNFLVNFYLWHLSIRRISKF